MKDFITCPKCYNKIKISEAVISQMAEEIRKDVESENKKKIQAALEAEHEKMLEKAKNQAKQQFVMELKDKQQQIKEYEEKLSQAQNKELELRKKERQINDREKELELEREKAEDIIREKYKNELEAELTKQKQASEKKIRKELEDELKEKESSVTDLEKKIKEYRKVELNLRKEQDKLQQEKEELELTAERERSKIRKEEEKKLTEKNHLIIAEKDKRINDLIKKIEDAQRGAKQGSQQSQGEIQELVLENALGLAFPNDSIIDIPKGVGGADIIQTIKTAGGLNCGTIIWESKRTKNWSNGWLEKLRKDQRNCKASIAVIVSEALPAGVDAFSCIDDVWVCSFQCAIGVAYALRYSLLETAKIRKAVKGQDGKMQSVYNYLTGPQFKNRLVGVIEAFKSMRDELETEKRVITKQWAKRDQQINQAVFGTASMYGDFGGIVGDSLPEIESVSLLQLEGS